MAIFYRVRGRVLTRDTDYSASNLVLTQQHKLHKAGDATREMQRRTSAIGRTNPMRNLSRPLHLKFRTRRPPPRRQRSQTPLGARGTGCTCRSVARGHACTSRSGAAARLPAADVPRGRVLDEPREEEAREGGRSPRSAPSRITSGLLSSACGRATSTSGATTFASARKRSVKARVPVVYLLRVGRSLLARSSLASLLPARRTARPPPPQTPRPCQNRRG